MANAKQPIQTSDQHDNFDGILGRGKPQRVAKTRFVAQLLQDEEEGRQFFERIFLWRSDDTSCEMGDDMEKPCETASGIYYGTSEAYEPFLCPRHFYDHNDGPRAPYRLIAIDELPANVRSDFEG